MCFADLGTGLRLASFDAPGSLIFCFVGLFFGSAVSLVLLTDFFSTAEAYDISGYNFFSLPLSFLASNSSYSPLPKPLPTLSSASKLCIMEILESSTLVI
jgi:hypothetical protein